MKTDDNKHKLSFVKNRTGRNPVEFVKDRKNTIGKIFRFQNRGIYSYVVLDVDGHFVGTNWHLDDLKRDIEKQSDYLIQVYETKCKRLGFNKGKRGPDKGKDFDLDL